MIALLEKCAPRLRQLLTGHGDSDREAAELRAKVAHQDEQMARMSNLIAQQTEQIAQLLAALGRQSGGQPTGRPLRPQSAPPAAAAPEPSALASPARRSYAAVARGPVKLNGVTVEGPGSARLGKRTASSLTRIAEDAFGKPTEVSGGLRDRPTFSVGILNLPGIRKPAPGTQIVPGHVRDILAVLKIDSRPLAEIQWIEEGKFLVLGRNDGAAEVAQKLALARPGSTIVTLSAPADRTEEEGLPVHIEGLLWQRALKHRCNKMPKGVLVDELRRRLKLTRVALRRLDRHEEADRLVDLTLPRNASSAKKHAPSREGPAGANGTRPSASADGFEVQRARRGQRLESVEREQREAHAARGASGPMQIEGCSDAPQPTSQQAGCSMAPATPPNGSPAH